MSVWKKMYELEYLVKKAIKEKDARMVRSCVVEMAKVLELKDPWVYEAIQKTVEEKINKPPGINNSLS